MRSATGTDGRRAGKEYVLCDTRRSSTFPRPLCSFATVRTLSTTPASSRCPRKSPTTCQRKNVSCRGAKLPSRKQVHNLPTIPQTDRQLYSFITQHPRSRPRPLRRLNRDGDPTAPLRSAPGLPGQTPLSSSTSRTSPGPSQRLCCAVLTRLLACERLPGNAAFFASLPGEARRIRILLAMLQQWSGSTTVGRGGVFWIPTPGPPLTR